MTHADDKCICHVGDVLTFSGSFWCPIKLGVAREVGIKYCLEAGCNLVVKPKEGKKTNKQEV